MISKAWVRTRLEFQNITFPFGHITIFISIIRFLFIKLELSLSKFNIFCLHCDWYQGNSRRTQKNLRGGRGLRETSSNYFINDLLKAAQMANMMARIRIS